MKFQWEGGGLVRGVLFVRNSGLKRVWNLVADFFFSGIRVVDKVSSIDRRIIM